MPRQRLIVPRRLRPKPWLAQSMAVLLITTGTRRRLLLKAAQRARLEPLVQPERPVLLAKPVLLVVPVQLARLEQLVRLAHPQLRNVC